MVAALVPLLFLAPFAAETPALATGRSPDLFDNVAIPAMQVVAAEALMALSWRVIDETHNDTLATAVLVSVAPAVTLSTCGLGAASRHHRGHCWHAVLGEALGAASGLVVFGILEGVPSLNPLDKGPDDTQTFVNGVAAAIYVAAIGLPLGSVIAWNAGKDDLVPVSASAAEAQPDVTAGPASPSLVARPRAAGTSGPPALILPLLAGTF